MVHDTIATDGEDVMIMNSVLERLETHETGTTTGDVQLDGTVREAVTTSLTVLGMEMISDLDTDLGTELNDTMATEESLVKITADETDVTDDAGTATGLDHEVGNVGTVAATVYVGAT